MTPRPRDADEEEAWVRLLVKQLEESWLRMAIKQLEDRTTGQHERTGREVAVLLHRVDSLRDEMYGKFMSLDKWKDACELIYKRIDEDKWVAQTMKWAALLGAAGIITAIMKQVLK